MKIFLLQFREDQKMADHELSNFLEKADVRAEDVEQANIFTQVSEFAEIKKNDVFILGGSGELKISKGQESEKIAQVEELIKQAFGNNLPMFGMCFGAQLIAKALGGLVESDAENGEVGTHLVYKNDLGKKDPLLADLPDQFKAQFGHEDAVTRLPQGAVNLASTSKCEVQMFTFPGKLIYGTTFHPELDKKAIHERVDYYKSHYGWDDVKAEGFKATTTDADDTAGILRRFLNQVQLG